MGVMIQFRLIENWDGTQKSVHLNRDPIVQWLIFNKNQVLCIIPSENVEKHYSLNIKKVRNKWSRLRTKS